MPITPVPSSSVDPVAQVVAALEAATATLAAAALTLADQGSWVTSTSYAIGDVVTQAGQRYCCRTAHTSGTFATDLAASKWVSLDALSPTAGGDLSGTLPSPTVARINGIGVSGTPAASYVLTATGTAAATWQAAVGAVASVVGQTGAVTGTQIVADAAFVPAVTSTNLYLASTYR